MAGRDGTKGNTQSRNAKKRRRQVAIVGAGASAFLAAAAMATGSAAPAHADIDTLLDPIIQPLMTSLSDAIAGFDPAAATDLTSWTDSLLASLNSIDLALPSAAEPAASAASSTSDPTNIPITMQEVTEPTVQATVDGQSTTLLVDTGSSGLVIPWQDLGSTDSSAFLNLLELGFPTSAGFSGFSGGIDYFYLTYDTTVDYGGVLTTPGAPVEVEVFSFPTSLSAPANFQAFLTDDDVTGILGIGPTGTGPATSPLEAAGFGGVTVDIPQSELVVGSNADANSGEVTVSGAPITALTESVNGGTPVSVSDDVDSGGVYGTIPSSLVGNAGTVPSGTKIEVFDGSTSLYTYTTGTDSLGQSTAPTVVSGTSIDSGIEPYLLGPIFIDYANNTLTFDHPT
jgi:hypothetical protein